MKKLYIGLILLFGFLSFVPQIALGDMITPEREKYEEQKRQRREILQEKALACLSEKKAKISGKYEGQNLKLEKRACREYDCYSTNMKYFIDPIGHLEIAKKDKYLLGNTTLSEKRRKKEIKRILSEDYFKNSFVRECEEYLTVYIPSIENRFYKQLKYSYIYNVTNVPPNSYLKFIPETSEVQVITPSDKEYKKFMGEYKKYKKKMEEEQLKRDMYIKFE